MSDQDNPRWKGTSVIMEGDGSALSTTDVAHFDSSGCRIDFRMYAEDDSVTFESVEAPLVIHNYQPQTTTPPHSDLHHAADPGQEIQLLPGIFNLAVARVRSRSGDDWTISHMEWDGAWLKNYSTGIVINLKTNRAFNLNSRAQSDDTLH